MTTILVVDDHKLNRELLTMLLGYAGHRVSEAANGQEALDSIQADRPDLVISDIVMPAMDGIEFANRLRSDPALRHIPVIFYTATYRLSEARKLALSCDVSVVIPKPSRPQVILETVASILGTDGRLSTAQAARESPERLPGEMEEQSLRLAALLEVALELSSEREPQRLLEVGCRAAQAVFDAKYAVVSTLEGGDLVRFAVSGFPDGMHPIFSMIDPERLLWSDEPRRLDEPMAAMSLLPRWHPRVRSLMVVPLKSVKQTIGWFYVADRSSRSRPFSEDDEQIGLTLGTLVAQNYENLRLYSESSTYSLQLEAEVSERKRAENGWRLSEEHFRKILDSAPIGMAVIGLDGRFVRVNRVLCDIVGYSKDELKVLCLQDIIEVEHPERIPFMQAAADNEVPEELELRCRRKDGGPEWVLLSASVLRDEQGEPLHFVVQIQDISSRKKHEEDLRLAASVFDNTLDGIFVADPEGRIVSVNNAFTAITGYSLDDAIGRKPQLEKSEQAASAFYDRLCEVLSQEGAWEGEVWSRRKDGEAFLQWLSISAVPGPGGATARYVGVFNDITEMRRKDERIHYLAFHDPLTDLPNRTLLLDRLEHSLASAAREKQRVGVMYVDVDHFKMVNDSLGHDVGDGLLQEVASRMKQTVRQSDTVGRVGGDEFIVILEHARELADYRELAQKVGQVIAQPIQLAGHTLHVTASIGVASFPEDGTDVHTLLKNADAAMYAAKQAGRGTHRFFHGGLEESAKQRLQLEAELRKAVANDELELHYQPTVALGTEAAGRVVEAMLRWRHPVRGLIFPSEFIALAEETGLIGELGDWVLEEACRQCRDWQVRGVGRMRIAVTVAAEQLQRGDLAERVAHLTWRYGIAPSDLEIKVTERAILANRDSIEWSVRRLHDIGVAVGVDSFGTEASTLDCLRRLPIDSLSIDRSFVMKADHDEKDAQIVRSILALGQALELEVVAEGVENESQANFLKACGCKMGQGYLFAQPAPASQVEIWLRGHANNVSDTELKAY